MKKILYVFVAINLLTSCIRSYTPVTGDLVFQDLDCGDLCNAIEKVTSGIEGADFSHVGIVSVEEDSAFVYEAIGIGVTKTPFQKFLNRSKDTLLKPKIFVGRLKVRDQNTISGAVNFCRSVLGKPYDDVFNIQNESFYCSELVYEAFRGKDGNSLFELSPMTYKDPDTGKTFPAWETYFKNLNVEIPEGKPGLNPGGVSKSPEINIVFRFYQP